MLNWIPTSWVRALRAIFISNTGSQAALKHKFQKLGQNFFDLRATVSEDVVSLSFHILTSPSLLLPTGVVVPVFSPASHNVPHHGKVPLPLQWLRFDHPDSRISDVRIGSLPDWCDQQGDCHRVGVRGYQMSTEGELYRPSFQSHLLHRLHRSWYERNFVSTTEAFEQNKWVAGFSSNIFFVFLSQPLKIVPNASSFIYILKSSTPR